MSNHCRPENKPWIIPYFTVKNARESIAFYEQAFGFELGRAVDDNGNITHVEMAYHDGALMFAPEGAWGGNSKTPANGQFTSPVIFYVYCEDVDALYKRAVQAKATSMVEPEDMFWGDRMCSLQDPDGHIWSFATHTGNFFEPPRAP